MSLRFSHGTVRCGDLDASAAFYRDVLGLRVRPVEDGPVRGYEVAAGGEAFLHLVEVGEALDRVLGRNGWHVRGRAALLSNLEHLAWAGDDPAQAPLLRERLRVAGILFRERTLTGPGLCQFLVDDPNGIELQISFPLH